VPEISRFFGIVIRMFAEPAAPHHRPHFHAYYQEASAVYAVDSIECIGGPLQNPSMFNAVRLDEEVGTVTWPNGADFDPSTLHDWPNVRDQFVGMARRWSEQKTSTARTAR
jgi:hypothetical protein